MSLAFLDELNARQKEDVLHTRRPLIIVAGAGTGKTRTLTHRIANLICTTGNGYSSAKPFPVSPLPFLRISVKPFAS